MYRTHFGLTHRPLDKGNKTFWNDGTLTSTQQRFQWLLESPGIGLLTGEPGVGKTALLRHLTASLNPHRYKLIYTPETDFGRLDLYRNLAHAPGLEPPYRRAALWRELKAHIEHMVNSPPIASRSGSSMKRKTCPASFSATCLPSSISLSTPST